MRFVSFPALSLALAMLAGLWSIFPAGGSGPPPETRTALECPPVTADGPSVAREVIGYAVTVYNSKRQLVGSGVRVERGVLTCKHVTDAALRSSAPGLDWPIRLVSRGVTGVDSERRARLVRDHAEYDLALLEVREPFTGPPAELAATGPVAGEDAWYCGAGGGVPFNLERSIVNQAGPEDIMTNGDVWFGHSGSGLFVVRRGHARLVGVLRAAARHPDDYAKTPGLATSLPKTRKFLAGK